MPSFPANALRNRALALAITEVGFSQLGLLVYGLSWLGTDLPSRRKQLLLMSSVYRDFHSHFGLVVACRPLGSKQLLGSALLHCPTLSLQLLCKTAHSAACTV